MKKFIYVFFLFFTIPSFATGVAIVNAVQGVYFQLVSSSVRVQVQNQVAITTSTQVFRNNLEGSQAFKYAFPMPIGGSAVGLRWQKNGIWYEADFNAAPQDTTLPGGGGSPTEINPQLNTYLGDYPLYFKVEGTLAQDSLITVELTYVELLPYKNGSVTFQYPGNYSLIQSTPLTQQHFGFTLSSGRVIESIDFISFPNVTPVASDYEATIEHDILDQPANSDFKVRYTLNANDLGLFSFSVFLSDTLDCDTLGNGFCAFVVEPNPNPNAEVIPKVFTLIIDRSGSMSGDKIVQAREAASFIVNNLNSGDLFNVIDFDNAITSFKPDHVPYTSTNRDAALNYISELTADGSTNISGAFSAAIPQFANDLGETYNIIIFFTDGEATAGITNTPEIIQHINSLITPLEKDLSIFTFGIGDYVNKPLLTQIANQNNGIAQFLGNDELADVISDFYQTVRNPVLLNTNMTFDPNLVYETYPIPLPNLFKGSQMIVVGRYNTPGTVNVNFTGSAYSQPVEFNYPMNLTDKDSISMRFLPKIWAKQKAEYLLQQYYATSNPGTLETLKAEIEHLSLCYGVITELTSFEDNTGGSGGGGGGTTTGIYETPSRHKTNRVVQIIAISPNPAYGTAQIQFELLADLSGEIQVNIYDLLGRKVATLPVSVNGVGSYTLPWTIPSNLSGGVYRMVITGETGSDTMLFIVK